MYTTIDDIIVRMDQIVEHCRTYQSRIGYFAVLYRRVTIRIKEGIERGEFEDNKRMETLDILFAKRFFDAYDAYQAGLKCTASWHSAFSAATSKSHLVMQHLLLGINAHINLDLGIAASETMEGKNLQEIKGDFDKINAVLSELVEGVKTNLGSVSPLFKWGMKWASKPGSALQGKDEMLVNFSIGLARDGAWRFAFEYHNAPSRNACIASRDQAIATIASAIVHPGTRLSRAVRLMAFTEWRSVAANMERLNAIAREEL